MIGSNQTVNNNEPITNQEGKIKVHFPFSGVPNLIQSSNSFFHVPHLGPSCKYPFPKMEPIGDLQLLRENKTVKGDNGTITYEKEWQFNYQPIPGAKMYWPGNKRLEEIRDEPICGFDGCPEGEPGSLKGIDRNHNNKM